MRWSREIGMLLVMDIGQRIVGIYGGVTSRNYGGYEAAIYERIEGGWRNTETKEIESDMSHLELWISESDLCWQIEVEKGGE